MTRRLLDSAIWKNEKFGVMPPMARLLAIGIINQADDQGRGKAHPVYLRSQVFPYDDVTAGQVSEWLAMVATNETILLYQVEGKDYYQILNWWSYQAHQYAMPSQYPKPDGWKDRIRKTLTKGVIVTCNWITTDGKPSPDTCDEQGLAIQVNNQVNNQVKVQDQVKDQVQVKVKNDEIARPPAGAPVTDFPEQDPEWGVAISKLEGARIGGMNGSVLLELNALWPDFANGKRDWLDDAILVARANNAKSPTYALRVLAGAIRDNKRPGQTPEPKARKSNGVTKAEMDAIFGVDIHGNPV